MFQGVLQVFYIDVAKVDRVDVAHVAMVIQVCFKYKVPNVSFVSSGCCKSISRCCIYMQVLKMFSYVYCKCFHLDVCNGYTRCFKFFWYFASVSEVCCKCCNCFRHMLQVFHLDVAKVDLVLHMLQWDPPTAAA
jgi:hypothetical protein